MKNLLILFCTILFFSASVFAQTDIKKVDFKNFTYQPDFCGGENNRKITVVNGEFSEEKEVDGYTDRMYFSVYGITFGDLDGDNKDEAVILSVCNTGGTGNFTEAYIYKMQNGKPVRVMLLGGGDRAEGGLREARIENGLLIVESNAPGEMGGACCPQEIVTNTYRFQDRKLKEVGKETVRELYPSTRILFDKGAFSKTINIKMSAAEEIKRFVIGAAKGQTLMVTKTSPKVRLRFMSYDGNVLEEEQGLVVKLEKNRDYKFDVLNYSDKEVELSITVTIK